MFLTFILVFLINSFIFQQTSAQPATCVSCVNCQDVYDGTDYNSTCSTTTPNASSCQKTRMQLPGTTLILKACAKSCKEQSIIAGPFRLDITCCTSNNCNGATNIILQPIIFFVSFFIIISI